MNTMKYVANTIYFDFSRGRGVNLDLVEIQQGRGGGGQRLLSKESFHEGYIESSFVQHSLKDKLEKRYLLKVV